MGDSFRVERRPCATPGCDNMLVVFTDASSVAAQADAPVLCPACTDASALHVREDQIA
jgi:hypothetical protein